MASKAMSIANIVFRVFTILLAAGCIVVLLLDKFTDDDGAKVTFKNFMAYRYLLSCAVVAAAYCFLQLPLALYYAFTEKRLIRGDFLPAFDFYGDKVIAFLLASGVGAGFLATFHMKDFFSEFFKALGGNIKDTPFEDFFNKGYLATGLLAGAFLCMAVLSTVLSSQPQSKNGSKGFFR